MTPYPVFVDATCDVCSRQRPIAAASLPFAPMSVAFCHECLRENAYPLWALHAGYDMNGGVSNTAEWFQQLRSWKDGHYIDGAEVLACYVPMNMSELNDDESSLPKP